jgi:hypothetical protein
MQKWSCGLGFGGKYTGLPQRVALAGKKIGPDSYLRKGHSVEIISNLGRTSWGKLPTGCRQEVPASPQTHPVYRKPG